MGTPGTHTRNGKKPAARSAARPERPHPAVAKLAVALKNYKEAVEQQAATAEVLRAMSKSPGDAQPVFEAIVDNAHGLCEAAYTVLYRYDGKLIHVVASKEVDAKAMRDVRSRYPQPPDRNKMVGHTVLEKAVFHTADIYKDSRFPAAGRAISSRRAVVCVPLIRNGMVLGVISCGRAEARAFTKREIWLLKTFADQAVIAIENARLFNETREALEHQKASADILRIVADSVENTDPVFEAITRAGMRLIPGVRVSLVLARDGQMHYVSHSGVSEERRAEVAKWFPMPLGRNTIVGTSIIDKRVMHMPDVMTVTGRFPLSANTARASGTRAMLAVPLVHDRKAVGSIVVTRETPGPFTEKQIALAKTFADQAVIAIRNAGMFREIQERNAALKQALDFQEASAEILTSISSSVTDAQPVFDAIVRSAARLCNARFIGMYRYDGELIHFVASHGMEPDAVAALRRRYPQPPEDESLVTVSIRDRGVTQVRDFEAEPDAPRGSRAFARQFGGRSQVVVPLLREGLPIGAIALLRVEAGAFPERELALLKTFADQAVIAIENARLFNETKEALEQQTATSEILKAIASSVRDVQPVFEAIVAKATDLCEAQFGALFLVSGEVWGMVSHRGASAEAQEVYRSFRAGPTTGLGRMARERKPIHIEDLVADAATAQRDPLRMATIEKLGARTFLAVPLLKDSTVIGAVVIYRKEVRPFGEAQIRLLGTFADQAVIAIENVRLFNETKEALERQTASSEVLEVISKSHSDLEPVFEAILASATRLCDAHLGLLNLYDGECYRTVAQRGATPEFSRWVLERGAFKPDRRTSLARIVEERRPIHVLDMKESVNYREGILHAVKFVELGGARSYLLVPLVKDDHFVGTIAIYRPEVRAFTEKQIELVKTFAKQAVIAIDNARLFNETKEALERQTATSDILRVISGSPTNVQPIFDAIARSAVKLCGGLFGVVFRYDGEYAHFAAHYGFSAEALALMQRRFPRIPEGLIGQTLLDSAVSHSPDVLSDPRSANPELHRTLGSRGFLGVPMLLDARPIGAIGVFRRDPGPFTDAQIALLRTFADQAVIAIENVRLFNETKEALEQQTAISEVLRVISDSPADVKPVLDAVAVRAAKICEASDARLFLVEGDKLRHAAGFGNVPFSFPVSELVPLSRGMVIGRAVIDSTPVHVEDFAALPADEFPLSRQWQERSGWRTCLCVPLVRENRALGVISLRRMEVRPFTEKQIALVKTFADQAAIAIENVRLFNELKSSNSTLREALDQQTATAEILKVISASPTNIQPVFDAILENATRLCDAHLGFLSLYDGEMFQTVAHHGANREFAKWIVERGRFVPSPGSGLAQVMVDRRPVQIEDYRESFPYRNRYPMSIKMVELGGVRSYLAVPMIKEGRLIGGITIYRSEVRAFTQKQIELLSTFADQAVIAIENVRLFNETKEALERQSATGEILSSISSSVADAQPVFEAIVKSLCQLFGTRYAVLALLAGDRVELKALAGDEGFTARVKAAYPYPATDEGMIATKATKQGRVVQLSPIVGNPEAPPKSAELARLNEHNSIIVAPLMREAGAIGYIVTARAEAAPFDEKQVQLIRSFADQAVIAIENARLFKELQERTVALTKSVDQLTALGEVGQAITSTLDLETVLKTIVQRAVQLTGLDGGSIYEYDEQTEEFRLQAAENMDPELLEAVRRTPVRKGEGAIGRSAVSLEPVQVPDIFDESYRSPRKELVVRAGYRAVLAVPLLREDHILGVILVNRGTPGPFAAEVVDLLKTFATQSALAIQNARLFREIAEKGKQLEVASQHKSQFLASMSHELRTPLNALLGFNEMILGDVYGEVPGDMKPPLAQMQASGKHLLRLINNVLDLAKIEAGRMELALSDYTVHDTVESVRLALRPLAADKGLELLAAVPADMPLAYGDPGRITQCLMNLAGNSLKFTKAGKVEISVALDNGRLRYSVADTGIGIPADKIESLFTEFKQTDATVASEYGGTGLGLSITKKFVEMHGGRIWVESEPGRGSTFSFEIPLRAREARAA